MSTSRELPGGYFGIERETLRIDGSGRLAKTPHPFGDEKYITRDFCESQVELVTPVCNSIDEALDCLEELDTRVRSVIEEKGEKLWIYSNPPRIESEDDILIADFRGEHSSKRSYREVLEQKYGKRLMLFSGIHFNFSFDNEALKRLDTHNEELRHFKDELYLRLYKQLMVHSWLLVLLTAASPYYDASFDGDGKSGMIMSRYSSMRNSERGYWNKFVPVLDHSSLESFVRSIEDYVSRGELYSASELYLPVRLKPRGENSLNRLLSEGVDHIELRMFDLNPFAPLGVDGRDLKFAHLLMIYLLSLPDFDLGRERQIKAVKEHKDSALINTNPDLLRRGEEILADMAEYFLDNECAQEIISFENNKLERQKRCSDRMNKVLCKAVI